MDETNKPSPHTVWWTISGKAFLDALRRAAAGEDPDLIYLEYYVNSDGEDYREKEEEN